MRGRTFNFDPLAESGILSEHSKYEVESPISSGVGDSIIEASSIGHRGMNGQCHCRGKISAFFMILRTKILL